MARVLVLIFFVIGGVAWAVTFSVYAFSNPDMVENQNVDCWARNDFSVPVSGPPATNDEGEIVGTAHATWDEMNVNTTMI